MTGTTAGILVVVLPELPRSTRRRGPMRGPRELTERPYLDVECPLETTFRRTQAPPAKRTSLGEGSVDLLLLFFGAAHLR